MSYQNKYLKYKKKYLYLNNKMSNYKLTGGFFRLGSYCIYCNCDKDNNQCTCDCHNVKCNNCKCNDHYNYECECECHYIQVYKGTVLEKGNFCYVVNEWEKVDIGVYKARKSNLYYYGKLKDKKIYEDTTKYVFVDDKNDEIILENSNEKITTNSIGDLVQNDIYSNWLFYVI
jgi:hypothetical protein